MPPLFFGEAVLRRASQRVMAGKERVMNQQPKQWHHGPLHRFVSEVIYMVTAGTHQKQAFFDGSERLALLQNCLFEVADAYGWELQAWAIFANHYHFIALAPEEATTLKKLVKRLHSQSARFVNRLDGKAGRKVWFQYWDTCITYEKSYYPRLKYVHQNPVKHGVAKVAENYPFCSAGWFEQRADTGFYRKVMSYGCDHVDVPDDF